jgi:hypothetical protein
LVCHAPSGAWHSLSTHYMNVLLIILVILASFLCLQGILYMWLIVGIKRQELDSQRGYLRDMQSPTDLLQSDWTGGD